MSTHGKEGSRPAGPIITVIEHAGDFIAFCRGCKEMLGRGKYTLVYELGKFKFFLGEKTPRKCPGCDHGMEIPVLFAAKEEALRAKDAAMIDAMSCAGMPGVPFIEMSSFPELVMQ